MTSAHGPACQICGANDWEILLNHSGPSICSGGEIIQNDIPLLKGICRKCAFVYTLKTPLDSDLDGYYRTIYSAKLEDSLSDYFNFSVNASFGDALNDFVMSHPYPANGRMLDIACGKGFFGEAFRAKHPQWHMEGVDPSVRSIQLAQKRNPGILYHTRKFNAADYRPASYDLVALHTILNRVPARAFLADAITLAKPGGIVSVEIAVFPEAPFELYFADHSCHYHKEHFLYLASDLGLRLIKEDARGTMFRFLFEKPAAPVKALPLPDPKPMREAAFAIADGWKNLVGTMHDYAASGKTMSFYGAGTTLGILLALTDFPEKQIHGVYDETPTKIGRLLQGKPIQKLNASILQCDAIGLCAGSAGVEIMKKKIHAFGSATPLVHV